MQSLCHASTPVNRNASQSASKPTCKSAIKKVSQHAGSQNPFPDPVPQGRTAHSGVLPFERVSLVQCSHRAKDFRPVKINQAVLWGKEARYFEGHKCGWG